ncbi:hypothetical protein MPH47_15670 [Psychrobacillus psychrodurans]|uniref:hypothetical protein n=1 Tax=Psychrobacillus TaxID=1221880 RepID=UPI001F4ECD81|nr:hypothetical protein [Psychrobacillus psychrodurans]MCK1998643.1 hypothetical protein [Psychrobacillus psychrodurans]
MKIKLLFGSAIIVIMIAIFGVREVVNFKHVGDGDKSINDKVIEVVGEEIETEVYDPKLGKWASKMNVMLSEPMDDQTMKKANNDEGFEYYLKAQEVVGEFPYQLIKASNEMEKEQSNLFLLTSYISHKQFARTVHLGSNGEAKESTELVDQWAPTDEYMRQAYEYMKQIVNDIDVAVNHNGEGKTYGVTYLLNGEKVFEVEKFINGMP